MAAAPFAAPSRDELAGSRLGRRELAAAEKAGRLLRVTDDVVLLPSAPDQAVELLRGLPDRFTVSQARQVLGSSRRVVVPLLEYLDARGLTERCDDQHRRLATPLAHADGLARRSPSPTRPSRGRLPSTGSSITAAAAASPRRPPDSPRSHTRQRPAVHGRRAPPDAGTKGCAPTRWTRHSHTRRTRRKRRLLVGRRTRPGLIPSNGRPVFDWLRAPPDAGSRVWPGPVRQGALHARRTRREPEPAPS